MRALIIILALCLYEYHFPAPLEGWILPDYTYAEVKRKVGKRKKGNPLKRKAPYPINSSNNLRKVNTFKGQSQYPQNRTLNVKIVKNKKSLV